jgi:hypothetical protein
MTFYNIAVEMKQGSLSFAGPIYGTDRHAAKHELVPAVACTTLRFR